MSNPLYDGLFAVHKGKQTTFIFDSLNNKGVQTKPTSEEEIGEWLDNFVIRDLSGCFK